MKSQTACVVLSGVLFVVIPAQARMYQWINPSSGNTQFSGTPPTWYRSPLGGPRILVFESGKVIDDTAIVVPDGMRNELRSRAFQAPESAGAAASALEVPVEREAEPAAADLTAAEGRAETGSSEQETDAGKAASADITEMDADTVGRLKDIISAWDRMKLEQAKELIRGATSTGPQTP
ncbi:MAG: hypothetical protein ACREVH_03050 [Gammaproteobacteria bacterium]